MSSTVVRSKELFSWNGNEEEIQALQAISVCPVSVKNQKLFYEVEMDEKKKLMTPEEILVHIYQKLYGESFVMPRKQAQLVIGILKKNNF